MELKDKICLITGATSGIGRAAAEKFATTGGELILVVRNRNRGERIIKNIIRNSANPKIKLFTADLSSISEVKELADSILSNYKRIDVLINNAGAYFSKFHLTVDGIEASFAVNYLSRFLLTNKLLRLILNSSSGRIINITGEYYKKGTADFVGIVNKSYSPLGAVSQAKLADMLFVMELARRLKNTSVTVNAFHPGTVATGIISNDPDASEFIKLLYSTVKGFFKSPKKVAEEIYYLAYSEDMKDKNGKYFSGQKIKEPLKLVNDEELAARLWKLSENLTAYTSSIFNKPIMENK